MFPRRHVTIINKLQIVIRLVNATFNFRNESVKLWLKMIRGSKTMFIGK